MRIVSLSVKNFGSYESLSLELNEGLTLIQGSTGAGKSTIMDAALWCMYGVTAKNGTVDDVRNWKNLDEVTEGEIVIETRGEQIKIYRVRGKSTENDLVMTTNGNEVRGVNSKETQKLINQTLGVDEKQFTACCYYNEFSLSAQFFTATPLDRRKTFTNLCDLTFPNELLKKIDDESKKTKKLLEEVVSKKASVSVDTSKLKGEVETLQKWLYTRKAELDASLELLAEEKKKFDLRLEDKKRSVQRRVSEWDERTKREIGKLEQDIGTLKQPNPDTRCTKCDQSLPEQVIHKHEEQVQAALERLTKELDNKKSLVNPYLAERAELFYEDETFDEHIKLQKAKQLEELTKLTSTLDETDKKYQFKKGQLTALNVQYNALNDRLSALKCTSGHTTNLRSKLLESAIRAIQQGMNTLLAEHFDSDLKVYMEITEDHLEVLIDKSGYTSNFKQLSKGQRQLLKLCFSVAVMEVVSNQLGIRFGNLFFDEAIEGLDEPLKLKAFTVFEKLSIDRNSVLVVDHTVSFQNMFSTQYIVNTIQDTSRLNKK
jgi:exonuclease SbcC